MIVRIAGFLVWMLVWFVGCRVCMNWLDLQGSWLMLGGALTFMVCQIAQEIVRLFGDD